MTSSTNKPNRGLVKKSASEARAVAPIVSKALAEIAGIPYLGALAGALTDLFKERKERLRESMLKENDERLSAFFSEMLITDGLMDEQIAKVMMDDADFHALCRACVADIEAEKVGPYAALARNIACGNVSQEWRRHFILSLRDFSNAELQTLRRAFIATRHDIISSGAGSLRQEDELTAGAPGSRQAIVVSNLTARGFVHDRKLSNVGELFTQACWREDQLSPAAIGKRTWSGHNIPVLNYEIGAGTLDNLSFAVNGALLDAGVKSGIMALTRDSAQTMGVRCTMAVLLVGGASKHLISNISHLTSFVSKVPTLLVEVATPGDALKGLPLIGHVVCGERPPKDVLDEIFAKLNGHARTMTRAELSRI